jgi:predicted transcriptional regulator
MKVQESPLELENRRHLYKLIEKFPGIHFRELFRKLDISMGSLEYHLQVLEKSELIYLKKEGGFTRYFVQGKLDEIDKKLATMLRNDRLRKLLFTLILNPGISHKRLIKELNWPKSTISFYLKKLHNKDIIEERPILRDESEPQIGKTQKGIHVTRPDKVIHLVVLYKSGFFDELSNRILDLVEVI